MNDSDLTRSLFVLILNVVCKGHEDGRAIYPIDCILSIPFPELLQYTESRGDVHVTEEVYFLIAQEAPYFFELDCFRVYGAPKFTSKLVCSDYFKWMSENEPLTHNPIQCVEYLRIRRTTSVEWSV